MTKKRKPPHKPKPNSVVLPPKKERTDQIFTGLFLAALIAIGGCFYLQFTNDFLTTQNHGLQNSLDAATQAVADKQTEIDGINKLWRHDMQRADDAEDHVKDIQRKFEARADDMGEPHIRFDHHAEHQLAGCLNETNDLQHAIDRLQGYDNQLTGQIRTCGD